MYQLSHLKLAGASRLNPLNRHARKPINTSAIDMQDILSSAQTVFPTKDIGRTLANVVLCNLFSPRLLNIVNNIIHV